MKFKSTVFFNIVLNCCICNFECHNVCFSTNRKSLHLTSVHVQNELWALKYIICTFDFISFSGQHSHHIYIFFYSIIKTNTQINRKLETCLFFFFFVVGRTLSYFAKFMILTFYCWFTACSQINRVTG